MNEAIITNFSPMANLYRNNFRPIVDKLFQKKNWNLEKTNSKLNNLSEEEREKLRNYANQLDAEARTQWREICKTAETL